MTYFTERQRFSQWWIWVVISIMPVVVIVLLATDAEKVKQEFTEWVIAVIVFSGGLPFVLFFLIRLDTSIADDGIWFRFYPFHFRERFIPWSEISRAYVRKYRPIAEYGGWGIRVLFGNGAYNVKGNIGLQLELTNGKKILLGTQKPAEAEAALKQLGK